jgi:hypothetical protein
MIGKVVSHYKILEHIGGRRDGHCPEGSGQR